MLGLERPECLRGCTVGGNIRVSRRLSRRGPGTAASAFHEVGYPFLGLSERFGSTSRVCITQWTSQYTSFRKLRILITP